eukprot:525633-Pyramimonas_sp.AAC.2
MTNVRNWVYDCRLVVWSPPTLAVQWNMYCMLIVRLARLLLLSVIREWETPVIRGEGVLGC